jgi:lysozyme
MTTPRQKAGAATAAILAACAICAPLTIRSEGEVRKAYRDPVRIPTQCIGHTGPDVIMGTTATAEQCRKWLTQDQGIAAEGVLRCVPRISERLSTFAAAVDFSFNAGVRTFCKSSMARLFNQGRWAEGCQAFLLYRFAGKPPRVLKGLLIRRQEEVKLCLRG